MPVSINDTQLVFNDGTTQTTATSSLAMPTVVVYTAPGTYTAPASVYAVTFTCVGGGGGGASVASNSGVGGVGGGGGATSIQTISGPLARSYGAIAVTVGSGAGAGGTGGTSIAGYNTPTGQNYITAAYGGNYGGQGLGGICHSGNICIEGLQGSGGSLGTTSGNGGGGSGGDSWLGGGGGAGFASSAAGNLYGGGGGGGRPQSTAGSAGAQGIVIIEEHY